MVRHAASFLYLFKKRLKYTTNQINTSHPVNTSDWTIVKIQNPAGKLQPHFKNKNSEKAASVIKRVFYNTIYNII